MGYDVQHRRLEHSGGTKEYFLTWIFDTATGEAYLVQRWGAIGRTTGVKVVRDPARTEMQKVQKAKNSRGYDNVAASHRAHHSLTADQVAAKYPDEWALILKQGASASGKPAFADVREVEVRTDIVLVTPAIVETITDNNPNLGLF